MVLGIHKNPDHYDYTEVSVVIMACVFEDGFCDNPVIIRSNVGYGLDSQIVFEPCVPSENDI